MKYISTRGEAQAIGFVDAVLSGLAPDGGLYVPDAWPTFSPAEIAAFAGRPYAEVASEVIGRFASPAIARDDLSAMCQAAYASFTHPCVTPLKELYPGLFLLELFHGPTLAFKDVAMQLLAQLYDHVLGLQKRTMTIVCATSGDTGGAAVEAFRGRHNVRIVALFPEGRISEVQRRFMTTAHEANVRCVAVEGTFDDCQNILKGMFQDEAFSREVDLSGVNSINWARIAAQAVYYFTAGVALGAPHRPVSFAVPTGNFGDAFAGYVASRMGLPIERIVVATNGNDILARALQEGDYARGAVLATQSPAMDIQISSNFERLFFEATGRDSGDTGAAFRDFARAGAVRIPDKALAAMRELFVGAAVSEDETTRAIIATFNETGELIDPHTAVAVAAARRIGPARATTPMAILSTAHPAKFPESVEAAAGVTPVLPASVGDHSAKPERFDRLPADAQALKAYVRQFAAG
jgi:threonine synthase